MLVIYQSERVRLEIEGLNDDHPTRLEVLTVCQRCNQALYHRDFTKAVLDHGLPAVLVHAMGMTDDEVVRRHQCPFSFREREG